MIQWKTKYKYSWGSSWSIEWAKKQGGEWSKRMRTWRSTKAYAKWRKNGSGKGGKHVQWSSSWWSSSAGAAWMVQWKTKYKYSWGSSWSIEWAKKQGGEWSKRMRTWQSTIKPTQSGDVLVRWQSQRNWRRRSERLRRRFGRSQMAG